MASEKQGTQKNGSKKFTHNECKHRCNYNDSCNGFQYSVRDQACKFFFGQIEHDGEYGYEDAGTQCKRSVWLTAQPTDFKEVSATDNTYTFERCKTECNEDDACTAFEFSSAASDNVCRHWYVKV